MTAWNTRDWEPEDKSWELTEEDTDDEFDDVALSRLGIELPECAKETRVRSAERRTSTNIDAMMSEWARIVGRNPDDLSDAMRHVMNGLAVVQPMQGWGVDPVRAGFDGADERCEDCGMFLYECSCNMDDYSEEDYCYMCGMPLFDGCECES